jgi:hypothetical protein
MIFNPGFILMMKKNMAPSEAIGYRDFVMAKSMAGFSDSCSLGGHKTADIRNDSRFFCVQTSSLLLSLGRVGWGAVRLAGCLVSGSLTCSTLPILRLAMQVGGKYFFSPQGALK